MQYLIWNRHARRPGRPWHAYGGTDPHTGHAHVEQNRDGAAHVTRAQLDRAWARWTARHHDQEDDDMDARGYYLDRIRNAYRRAGRNPDTDPDGIDYWCDRLDAAHEAGDDLAGQLTACRALLKLGG